LRYDHQKKWPPGRWLRICLHATISAMDMESRKNKPTNRSSMEEIASSAEVLYVVERHFREKGVSEFVYDDELDGFRFPEENHSAFLEEFARLTPQ
jgi:hypothetical protein